jgi:hypothetical protein
VRTGPGRPSLQHPAGGRGTAVCGALLVPQGRTAGEGHGWADLVARVVREHWSVVISKVRLNMRIT